MRKILAGVAAVTCVVPALAFAADPKPDSHFKYCKSDNRCPMMFNTNKAGSKIQDLTMYAKCSDIPVGKKGTFPPVPVNDEGKFSKKGSIDNLLGEKVNYSIQGKFKKPGKAVGTYKLTTGDCNDSKRDFVAKRDGPAL